MEITMKQLLTGLLLSLGVATILAATAQAKPATGTVVSLAKTGVGTILVDQRGRTLYLFEKDRNGVSACNTSCLSYWPPLTSRALPRAGKGVQQSLLRLGRTHNGVRQVTYAGHPLYTFVGDKRAGQTTGEGLDNFGGGWYALAANGQKVERAPSAGGYGY
jgi:predicted lipoprotein with Yx(FWY)xxD motif